MSPFNSDEIVNLPNDEALDAVTDESDLLPDPMTDGVEVTELDSESLAAFAELESK